MIVVDCECGKRFSVPDELAGRTGRCTSCGWRLVVPLAQGSPEAAAAMEAALSASTDQLAALTRGPSSDEIVAVRRPEALPPTEALVGRQVAGYLVGRRLGDTQSSVFHAGTTDQREVAIKVLPRERSDRNPATAKRFLRQARALGRLSHPNLVRMLDAGEEYGSQYLTMELHPGISLEHKLRLSGDTLPETDVVSIVADVARGLDHLHAAGLVHRAVRPKHILVEPTKLCGFGLVREAGPTAHGPQDPGATHKGQTVGKVEYMSPEQIQGQPIDGRCDLFSLGVTMFRALTGALPFEGPTPMRVLHAILTTDAPPVNWVAPHVSDAASAIVSRLLAKDPRLRYATANELLNDL